jgi:hypothetical protein
VIRECPDMGASTAGRSWEIEDELTGGDGGIEREWAQVGKEQRRQLWPTGQREREGERVRAGKIG